MTTTRKSGLYDPELNLNYAPKFPSKSFNSTQKSGLYDPNFAGNYTPNFYSKPLKKSGLYDPENYSTPKFRNSNTAITGMDQTESSPNDRGKGLIDILLNKFKEGSQKRIYRSLDSSITPATATTCGLLGAATETALSEIGSEVVYGSALIISKRTGYVGVVTALAIIDKGPDLVEKASSTIGDFSERACQLLHGERPVLRKF